MVLQSSIRKRKETGKCQGFRYVDIQQHRAEAESQGESCDFRLQNRSRNNEPNEGASFPPPRPGDAIIDGY